MIVEVNGLARRPQVLHVRHPDHPPLHLGLLDVATQLDRPVRDVQVAERPTHLLGGDTEQHLGLAVGQRHQAVRRDHDLGDRAGQVGLAAQAVQADQLAARGRLGQLGEERAVARQHPGASYGRPGA